MNKSNRRKFLATAAVLGAGSRIAMGSVAGIGAGEAAGSGAETKKPLAHHVFFWLKNPDSAADRDKLVEGVKTLKKIPTVKEIHVGVLAATEKRDVVDASWQVSELIFFSDVEGQATYQTHPVHLEFVKNYSSLWSKVVVYDAMEV